MTQGLHKTAIKSHFFEYECCSQKVHYTSVDTTFPPKLKHFYTIEEFSPGEDDIYKLSFITNSWFKPLFQSETIYLKLFLVIAINLYIITVTVYKSIYLVWRVECQKRVGGI